MQLDRLLTMRGLPPHGYCLLWNPALIWLHVVSDAVIGISYFSIPIALSVLMVRRRDIEFNWIVVLFAVFITACGATHFLSIWVLWVPAYGIEGLVKALTALASVATAIALWPLLPRLIALPSPSQLQRANDDLRTEVAERMALAERLRQSQKLEAIGQLTGGIAHDFNNILTIIMGGVDRAMRGLDNSGANTERAKAALGHAMEASQRAALLTDHLLAFARKRPMQIERHDLHEVIGNVATLLRPTIGERITLTTALSPEPLIVEIDRTQLETALINLAVNARDAMPDGGTLLIRSFVEPGGSPAVAVEDTGCGMDAETLEHATEPFYSTKPVGQGTGLGLSQVYGFANQTGGRFDIASQPGKGTVVTLSFKPQGNN